MRNNCGVTANPQKCWFELAERKGPGILFQVRKLKAGGTARINHMVQFCSDKPAGR